MRPDEQAANHLSTRDQLDQVRMRPGERQRAKAYLRQAELLADMLLRVDVDLCRILNFVGTDIGAVARRSNVRAVTPEPI